MTTLSVPPDIRREQQRHRNIATFAALLLFVILVYAVTLVRMGGPG